jgi:hypothetical protein
MTQSRKDGPEIVKISKIISPPIPEDGFGETVVAEISNDYLGGDPAAPFLGAEFRYRMLGTNLEGPLPNEYRTGFSDAESAAVAAEAELRQWRAGDIPDGTQMPRHVFWRTRYRRRRYLANIPDEVLVKRFLDLMNLSISLTGANKIGFRSPSEPDAEYVAEVHTHVMEEFVLRRYKMPGPIEGLFDKYAWPIPDYSPDKLIQADSVWEGINQPEGSYLIKYGKIRYLEPFLETGITRIAPATIYSDPSLNPSIRDDETSISGYAPPPFAEPSSNPDDLRDGGGSMRFTFEANSNFYVYCLAGVYDRRLLSDFEADCFLVIKDPRRFCQDLLDAGMEQLGEVSGKSLPVRYFDPFNVDPSGLTPYTSKDFRYSFQGEYRLFWTPKTPTWDLVPVNVRMPQISDYCELVRLAVPDDEPYLGRKQ